MSGHGGRIFAFDKIMSMRGFVLTYYAVRMARDLWRRFQACLAKEERRIDRSDSSDELHRARCALRETGAVVIIVNDSSAPAFDRVFAAVAPQFRRVPNERTTGAASGKVAR